MARSHGIQALEIDGEAVAGSYTLGTRYVGAHREWTISGRVQGAEPPPETGRARIRLASGQTVEGDVLLTIHRMLVTRNPKAIVSFVGTDDLEGDGAADLW